MNKAQKIIISIALIIMGLWTFLFLFSQIDYMEEVHWFFLSLLAFAFIVLALVILFNFKKRS